VDPSVKPLAEDRNEGLMSGQLHRQNISPLWHGEIKSRFDPNVTLIERKDTTEVELTKD
jgi:hypothetical protein